ncbi:MAG: hypothetical protein ACTSRC_08405 [Candidatus Helarchaeota archaeon]
MRKIRRRDYLHESVLNNTTAAITMTPPITLVERLSKNVPL